VSGAAGRSAEVLRARGGVGVEVGTASRVWQSHISIKDVCGLAQAKGLASLIYHEPVLEVRFMRGRGHDENLTIRRPAGKNRFLFRASAAEYEILYTVHVVSLGRVHVSVDY
jgi:hypothetical protein